MALYSTASGFMKLMLRPEWRLWPLSSFLGIVDIKTGVVVGLIFAEDSKSSLYFAHIYFADHIFSTSWTVFFAVDWWLWTPHDGQRQANSPAQQAMVKLANITAVPLTPQEREEAAMTIWNHEKGKAAAIIIISWFVKLYFIVLIYSYASHLRKGSYRSLPLTRSAYASTTAAHPANAYEALGHNDDDVEDFYRVPLQTPPASGHRRGGSQHSVSGSVDFVSAPGRIPRKKGFGSMSLSNGGTRDRRIEEEDVLFDEDEATYAASSSSRAHSKLGTDSTLNNSDEERAVGGFASDSSGKSKSRRS
ncbi:hypothetical protein CC1G_00985 [Coprinopsis cinerea okayama7|uniref:DUF1753-domain-containing protein n=1 Tax=Coprinopsis cinerea (strain Okayama-7 / 130 / ATCC MYA-4618 / FGSC 9003) TaxID=240176 RepID=A8N9B0_COPC7|nr:hypothetical protein CC1G_00985 [Coprinopsis cinerea okayama7\|eukprot:XP_001831438.2 hypothetical protein CC1G_00985 [Coprinopsis cinerea okayama7\